MFYVPGLIYSLGNITCDEHSTGDDENEVVTVNKYESFDDIEDDEEDDEEDDDEDDEKDEDEE
mgnify:FL=1